MLLIMLVLTNLVQELYEQERQHRKASNHGTLFPSKFQRKILSVEGIWPLNQTQLLVKLIGGHGVS